MSHITLRQYPPGSFRVEYGGIRGFIRTQLIGQFRALHRDWIEINYADRPIASRKELEQISDAQSDINNGGAWFERRWWESLTEAAGGAPNNPIFSHRGPVGNLIDVGAAYLTADFKFKWREYNISLNKIFSPSSYFYAKNKWNFRIRPDVGFSIKTIIGHVAIGGVIDYLKRDVSIIRIDFYVRYSIGFTRFNAGFLISFLQW